MRVGVKQRWVCWVFLFATVGVAAADPGDVYQAGGNFSSERKMKASDTPILWAVMSIPPDLAQGDMFTVNCRVDATKNAIGDGAKGVQGSAAAFANQLNVAARSWQFFGLVGSGMPFKTAKDGSALLTTGPVAAGAWANNPGANDNISISATFTNRRRVFTTSFGCEIVIEAAAAAAGP